MNVTATAVFIGLFVFITVLGFASARWKAGDLKHLHEWGLGGRRFGAWITWFLIGGDLYTAYTFVAVPALVFGAGALGFFALPYTVLVVPFFNRVEPQLWGIPFFYWWQMLWVPLSGVFVALVYRKVVVKRAEGER